MKMSKNILIGLVLGGVVLSAQVKASATVATIGAATVALNLLPQVITYLPALLTLGAGVCKAGYGAYNIAKQHVQSKSNEFKVQELCGELDQKSFLPKIYLGAQKMFNGLNALEKFFVPEKKQTQQQLQQMLPYSPYYQYPHYRYQPQYRSYNRMMLPRHGYKKPVRSVTSYNFGAQTNATGYVQNNEQFESEV